MAQTPIDKLRKNEFSFVVDELCMVVSVDPPVNFVRTDIYAPVMQRLTTLFGNFFQSLGPEGSTRQQTPWVALRRDGKRSTVLCFYQVIMPVGSHYDEAARRTQNLIHTINARLQSEPVPVLPGSASRIIAATPNWLSGGAQSAGSSGTGGPGSAPKQVPAATVAARSLAANPPFGFAFPAQLGMGAVDPAAQVAVAVLDTAPSQENVDGARNLNALLAQVAGDPNVWLYAGNLSLQTPADFQHLARYLPRWHGGLEQWENVMDPAVLAQLRKYFYAIPDHGLFVTGIIASILAGFPGASAPSVHLIRVLDDAGAGDLHAIGRVLEQLPAKVLGPNNKPGVGGPPEKRLVVNLSLTVQAPNDQAQPFIFPAFGDLAGMRAAQDYPSDRVDPNYLNIAEIIAWLGEEWGVLVVAAAGNDNLAKSSRPEARAPARFDEVANFVIGVSAVKKAPQIGPPGPSSFSDQSDKGVAVFGGDAQISALPDAPPEVVPSGGDDFDAVVGIWSMPTLPFGADANDTGWVYWSGTSFATPIVSAIAARYWMEDLSQTAGSIRNRVLGLAIIPEPALGTQAIPVVQA